MPITEASSSNVPPTVRRRTWLASALEPFPVAIPPMGTREICGLIVGLAVGRATAVVVGRGVADVVAVAVAVAVGLGVADAVAVGLAAAVIVVVIEARQVSSVPPAFPVPLHWLTLVGIAALTVEPPPTEQLAVEPPPVTDPLHWVMVALVVEAG